MSEPSSELTEAQRANIELTRAGLGAYNEGDPAAALPFIHEEVVVWTDPMFGNPGTYRGHDGYLRWANMWEEAWEEFHVEPLEIIPVGDHDIVAAVRQTGRGAGSGIEVDMKSAFHYRIVDGKTIRLGLYRDVPAAIEAARSDASATLPTD